MKLTRFTFCILSVVLVLVSGCTFLLHPINSTFARHSNPIADWTFRALDDYSMPRDRHHYQLDKAIIDDYQHFIADKKKFPYPPDKITGFFEDGKGQRAVQITIGLKGTHWVYALIYDRNDERIKVIKYVSGYYMCGQKRNADNPERSGGLPAFLSHL